MLFKKRKVLLSLVSIKSYLKPLQINVKTRLAAPIKVEQKFLLHLLLVSYVADLPETEHLLAMKRASQIFTSYHIYRPLKKVLI